MEVKFKSGKQLYLTPNEVREFCTIMSVEMITLGADRIYWVKDSNVDKIDRLYKMILEQKDMSKEQKERYLEVILKLSETSDTTVVSLQEEKLKHKDINP